MNKQAVFSKKNGLQLILLVLIFSILSACSNKEDPTYTIGGTVNGLSGKLILQLNGSSSNQITQNGSFTMAGSYQDGFKYVITALNQSTQICTVTNGDGTVNGANVTNIVVSCTDNPCLTKKHIFITASTYLGDSLAGINGADEKCMSDANYPGTGTYKALIADGVNRLACSSPNCSTNGASEHVHWVLAPNTSYVQSDGSTDVGTTTSNGIFAFPVTNGFNNTLSIYWSGLNSDWTSSADNCDLWMGDSPANVGSSNTITTDLINSGSGDCAVDLNHLTCVEQ